MRPVTPRPLGRIFSVVLSGMAFAVLAMPAASVASTRCAAPVQDTDTISVATVRSGTLCRLNAARATHGLDALTLDRRLSHAALGHTSDMVEARFFAHDSQSGLRFSSRIQATGWMQGREQWTVGENLAWGSGSSANPAAIMTAWMLSPEHRRNILESRFRVVGIGIGRGTPSAGAGHGMTYTTDFGS